MLQLSDLVPAKRLCEVRGNGMMRVCESDLHLPNGSIAMSRPKERPNDLPATRVIKRIEMIG